MPVGGSGGGGDGGGGDLRGGGGDGSGGDFTSGDGGDLVEGGGDFLFSSSSLAAAKDTQTASTDTAKHSSTGRRAIPESG